MSVLQFTIEEAYTDNTCVTMYKDGHKIDEDIISNYALSGYLKSLINQGYEYAYDVDEYKRDWEEAKAFERETYQAYLHALKHPLMKTDR